VFASTASITQQVAIATIARMAIIEIQMSI
jgi:hypothetical protein